MGLGLDATNSWYRSRMAGQPCFLCLKGAAEGSTGPVLAAETSYPRLVTLAQRKTLTAPP